MLQLELDLKPEIEKEFIDLVTDKFNGSYEKLIETILVHSENTLSKLAGISEDLGISDLAENHDHYLYGVSK